MSKASTIYAAFGSKKQQQEDMQGVRATHQSITNKNSSGQSSDTPQQQPNPQPSTSAHVPQQRYGLRATNSSNSRDASLGTSSCLLPAQPPSFSLEPRNWIQQAADITEGLLDASKYKSLAVYAEVKLTEALDKAAQACPNSIAGAAPEDCDDDRPLPNPLATAVCCQLLGEISDLCGPFQPTLLKLREALLPAIYSSCSGPSLCGSRPLQFDMLPWFALAGRLRRQNNQLLEQQAAFSTQLSLHKEQMELVEEEVQGLQAALEAGAASAAALQATNTSMAAERAAAVAEAAAATDEVKKLTREIVWLSADLDEAREQLSTVKEEYSNEQEQWKAQLDVYLQKLHVEAHERAAALTLASTEQQELEHKLWEVERKLEEAEQQLQQHITAPQPVPKEQQLTSRPSEAVLQHQHAAELAALQRQLQVLAALTQPDPAPRPWQLNLRADALKYFLTELDPEADLTSADDRAGFSPGQGPTKPKLFAAGLGLGPDVPKFLRWDEPVEVHEVSLQDLEKQVAELWQAKAAHEANIGPCCFQTFLHEHLWVKASPANTTAATAAAELAQANAEPCASTDTVGAASAGVAGDADSPAAEAAAIAMSSSGAGATDFDSGASNSTTHVVANAAAIAGTAQINSSSVSATVAEGAGVGGHSPADNSSESLAQDAAAGGHDYQAAAVATAAAAAAAGYQLYHACCMYRHDSTVVQLFWRVLTGQLGVAALQEQRQLLQALILQLQGLQCTQQANTSRDGLPAAVSPQDAAAAVVQQDTPLHPPGSVEGTAGRSTTSSNDSSSSAAGGSEGTAGVPWHALLAATQAAVHTNSRQWQQQQQQAFTRLLAAACGMHEVSSRCLASTGSTADSSSDDSPSSGDATDRVDAQVLAGVVAALQQEQQLRFGWIVAPATITADMGQQPKPAGIGVATLPMAQNSQPTAQQTSVRQLVDELLRTSLLQHQQQQ